MVMSCQPFTEVENEEFRDLLSYLKPFLKDMNRGDAMQTRILQQSTDARMSLKKILKVSARLHSCQHKKLTLTCVYVTAGNPKRVSSSGMRCMDFQQPHRVPGNDCNVDRRQLGVA